MPDTRVIFKKYLPRAAALIFIGVLRFKPASDKIRLSAAQCRRTTKGENFSLDEIIRAISGDGFVSVVAISSRGLTERARDIHKASRVCTAAMGRTMAAASILGSELKKDGASLTAIIRGGGPIGTVIAVSDSLGNVRCCAGAPEAELPLAPNGKLDVGRAVGNDGTLTVIRDDGEHEPYSSATELVSGEIAEDFASFLTQSEQIGAACALGVLIGGDGSVRAAGGYIMKLLPGAPEDIISVLERNITEAGAVTGMLDGGTAEDVARRVLHSLDPKFVSRAPVEYRCGCSRERVLGALAGIGKDDLRDIAEKGAKIEITCRFCDAVYTFSPDEL
ncbi:MAG: Hsp33 family molecular chaperone HslO [Oscillospiraceae bacterium]|nr:Hsp33 family molecular chaperone HslO [Oscillospiraceae bacterium]